MDLLTILITGIGSGVAKGILNLWLEESESTFGKEIGKNFISIFASKTKDVIAQRRGARQFDEVSEKVAQNLLPIFENAEGISEKRKQEIAELAGVAAKNLKISADLLVRENLDPKQIEKLLLNEANFPNEENPSINFTEKEETLYRRVMAESAQYIVDIASKLPEFKERTFAEILKRENLILTIATETLEEVKRIRKHLVSFDEQDREFETRYRKAVISNLDKLILFGVDVSDSTRKYKLSVAYVMLLVEYSGFIDKTEKTDTSLDDIPNREYEGEQILSIEEAISKSTRLLLRGAAGSGKTTLMKWIAVMSAGYNLNEELKDWNECVPFFIKLRNFPNADLPSPKVLPTLTAKSVSDEMPDKWVSEKLKAGKAIILVDGIDEIAESQREKVKKWIDDIDNTYPDNRWIVTSRPYAAKKGWLGDLGFTDADLQNMNVKNVESFIEHWHNAVRESEPESKGELDNLEIKLKVTIRENRSLRKLATNPLLCAIICALHKDRNKQLPSDRIQLYEACIDMFFRRDKERDVNLEDYIEIGDRQKIALLEDLAYWLIRNDKSECDLDFTDKRFDKKILALSDIPKGVNGKAVRRYFVERSGILRQPTLQAIDFPHRTFLEYFAAKAIVEESDFNAMIKNAANDQWREVIQLVCGIARRKEGNDAILEIIKLGDKETENKASLHLLAVACMGMLREIRDDVKLEVQHRLIKLVPPKNIEAAKQLASAENLVVPYLKYDKKRKAQELAMSVRTLAIIGEDKALSELSRYCQDRRESIKRALLNGIKYTKEPKAYAVAITLEDYKSLYLDSNMPLDILRSLPNLKQIQAYNYVVEDLTPFSHLIHLENLNIGYSKIGDLIALSNLRSLKNINIRGRDIQNLEPLAHLINLKSLTLNGEKIKDLTPLSNLDNLRKLYIGDDWFGVSVSDIEPLSNLVNLDELIINSRKLQDLSALSKLLKMKYLKISSNDMEDITPLSNLINLQKLTISGLWNRYTQVNDLSPLSELIALTYLKISKADVNSIAPISNLTELKRLYLLDSKIQDLSPLANLTNIEILNIEDAKIKDLNVLSKLINLKHLHIKRLLVSDLAPLSNLKNLKNLTLSESPINDLDALSGLNTLEKLDISGTEVLDISPLSSLSNLLELDISFTQVTDLKFLSNLPRFRRLKISKDQKKYLQTIPESKLKKLSVEKI